MGFDSIGRIDDETPFVVEWFSKHGIEVWGTQEGQQRFDNHVDKLMNYLRFWQASGESDYIGGVLHLACAPVVSAAKDFLDPWEKRVDFWA